MSSLITINNNKLFYKLPNLPDDKNIKIKIISVIGKARTGKSTLMNLLISKWLNTNTTIFKMSNSGEHCTNGVDYYYLKELNIILLDFQGIYLGDSSQDSKLLLLAYLLSDVIIFNENKMLSNNTLSQFEPMLSFIQYIHKDDFNKSNPKLIFRITDVNLNIEPTTNMHQMLTQHSDQFQSIRDCINELFDEPIAINTNNLDRNEFKLLLQEDFIGILKENDNGFNNAITKINNYIECCNPQRTFGNFINDIRRIVYSINNEERIDFKKLDIVLNLANYELLDYITKIDNELYTNIVVDGTQKLYENNLISRIAKRDEIVKDIYKKFSAIPKNIIDAQLPKFTDKINPLIEKAITDNFCLAKGKLNSICIEEFEYYKKGDGSNTGIPTKRGFISAPKFENCKLILSLNLDNKFIEDGNTIYDPALDITFNLDCISEIIRLNKTFSNIEEKTCNLFKCVFNQYVQQKRIILNTISTEFDKIKEIIHTSIIKCKLDIENFINDTLKQINDIIINTFVIEPDTEIYSYYNQIVKMKCNKIKKIILESTDYENNEIILDIEIDVNKMTVNTNCYSNNKNKLGYFSLLDKIFEKDFKDKMENIKKDIYKMLSNKRELHLMEQKSKIFTTDEIRNNNIIENNPCIEFVTFKLNNKSYTMTKKYFITSLKEDFNQICEICNKKGYINNWEKFLKEITNIKIVNQTTVLNIDFGYYKEQITDNYHKIILMELFELEFKKYYARNKFIFEF